MNNACLIAACAAGSRLKSEQNCRYKKYFNNVFDFYYKVKIKKTYNFESITLVTPVPDGPYYVGSIYAPAQLDALIRPVQVEKKSTAIVCTFPVLESQCTNGVDNYIKDNLERFASSSIWAVSDEQIVMNYVKELNNTYNIDLDPKSLTYDIQYSWEVDSL